jgi:hypothetical protein
VTVAACISLNPISNVVFFDNIIFQSSATRSTMRKQVHFIVKASDSMSLMDAGCPICACFVPWNSWCVFIATVCSLGCFFLSVTTLNVWNVENGWEGAGDTEEDHDSRCSLQGFETEIFRIPKRVFYHYTTRIIVMVCYTWNNIEVQSITDVKQNVGE